MPIRGERSHADPLPRKRRIYHESTCPSSDAAAKLLMNFTGVRWASPLPDTSLLPAVPSLALTITTRKPAALPHPCFPSCFTAAPLSQGYSPEERGWTAGRRAMDRLTSAGGCGNYVLALATVYFCSAALAAPTQLLSGAGKYHSPGRAWSSLRLQARKVYSPK